MECVHGVPMEWACEECAKGLSASVSPEPVHEPLVEVLPPVPPLPFGLASYDVFDRCSHGFSLTSGCMQCQAEQIRKNNGAKILDEEYDEAMELQNLTGIQTTPDPVVQSQYEPSMTAQMPSVFVPSVQQQGFFDWVQHGSGNAIVIAVAGSGKTTTLIQGLSRMRGFILLLAFNKKIAQEISEKVADLGLRNVRVSTFHAHGFGLWRSANLGVKVEGTKPDNAGYLKINRIFDEVFAKVEREVNGQKMLVDETCPLYYRAFVKKAVTFAKQQLFGVEIDMNDGAAWMKMVEHHNLDEEISADLQRLAEKGLVPVEEFEKTLDQHVQVAINWTVRCLRHSIKIANEVIDFEDMIYMPLMARMRPRYLNDWVLTDEAQDTNPARRAYARLVLKPYGRAVFVGDPFQSIYGFTGADSLAFEQIRTEFNCIDLPLTVSYRCPQKVVQVAQRWVKHIQAHESAPEGVVTQMDEISFLQQSFTDTDVILCRVNAPLVSLALRFIRRGIPCHVEGSDIAQGLVRLIDRFKDSMNFDVLTERLEEYMVKEVKKAMEANKESRAAYISDMVESVLAVLASMPAHATVSDLRDRIYGMFMDSENRRKPMLVLSSIHKSKGREWNRVFWYGSNVYQPSKYARQDWQERQERNLFYVAATRAKAELHMVRVTKQQGGPRSARPATKAALQEAK